MRSTPCCSAVSCARPRATPTTLPSPTCTSRCAANPFAGEGCVPRADLGGLPRLEVHTARRGLKCTHGNTRVLLLALLLRRSCPRHHGRARSGACATARPRASLRQAGPRRSASSQPAQSQAAARGAWDAAAVCGAAVGVRQRAARSCGCAKPAAAHATSRQQPPTSLPPLTPQPQESSDGIVAKTIPTLMVRRAPLRVFSARTACAGTSGTGIAAPAPATCEGEGSGRAADPVQRTHPHGILALHNVGRERRWHHRIRHRAGKESAACSAA